MNCCSNLRECLFSSKKREIPSVDDQNNLESFYRLIADSDDEDETEETIRQIAERVNSSVAILRDYQNYHEKSGVSRVNLQTIRVTLQKQNTLLHSTFDKLPHLTSSLFQKFIDIDRTIEEGFNLIESLTQKKYIDSP